MPRSAATAVPLAFALLLAGCLTTSRPEGLDPEAATGLLPLALEARAPSVVAANPYHDFETDVAANPLDPEHVAVFYAEVPGPSLTGATITDPFVPGMFYGALATSHDGGATWQRATLPYMGNAPPTSPWSLYCAQGDPNVFFDGEGVIHVVILALTCGGPAFTGAEHIVHATTRDDGATWSDPNVAWFGAGGLAVAFHDRQWSAIDPASGRIGIVWTQFQAALQRPVLTVVFSDDGGATWTLPQEIEDSILLLDGRNWMVHATWGTDGLFHVTGISASPGALVHWVGGPESAWQSSLLSADDCGAPADASVGYATSAVDEATGRIFVATPTQASDARGVCVWTSTDQGATWPVARYIADADHPWLRPTADGDAAVVLLAIGEDGLVTPTLKVLDAATLEERGSVAMAEAYDLDPDGDGGTAYGHYDGMALTVSGMAVWGLTRPAEGAPSQLDVHAYRAQVPMPMPAPVAAEADAPVEV